MRKYNATIIISGFVIFVLLIILLRDDFGFNKKTHSELLIGFDSSLSGQGSSIASYLVLQDGVTKNKASEVQFGVRDDGSNVQISIKISNGDDFVAILESVLTSLKSAGIKDKLVKLEWSKQ